MSRTKTIDPEKAEAAKVALVAAREEAQKAKDNHGLSIQKSIEKGGEIARQTFGADMLISDLSKVMGKMVCNSMSVTNVGLLVSDGYQPTEQEVTVALSGLCGINDETSKLKTSIMWIIGDTALLAERFEGGMDRVVAQAISEHGLVKHTVAQAISLSREFPYGHRIPGAPASHHLELKNYRSGIKVAGAYDEIVHDLRKSIEEGRCMSCGDLRERLSAVSTGNRKRREAEPNDKEFLYINEDSEVFRLTHVDKDICSSGKFLVINITDGEVLDANGRVHYTIPEFDPSKLNGSKLP